jgi:hypothetical protein
VLTTRRASYFIGRGGASETPGHQSGFLCPDRAKFGAPKRKDKTMPAKSKAQQKAAGAALSAKRGDTPKSKLKGPSKQMAESMSEAELKKMAATKRKGKPEHAARS